MVAHEAKMGAHVKYTAAVAAAAAAIFISLLSCLVDQVSASDRDTDNQVLQHEIRTLRSQVDGLLERRQDDFRLLQEYLDKNSEVAALRAQVQQLREELKHSDKSTQSKQNQEITVRWVAASFSEIRAEIAELSNALNVTGSMRERQDLAAGLDLLRGDVASVRRDLEDLNAEQQQTIVTLGQLKQDVAACLTNSQSAAGVATETKAELEGVKEETERLMRTFNKIQHGSHSFPKAKVKRHNVVLKKIRHNHKDDETVRENLLETRLAQLEASAKSEEQRVFNMSRHISELDRLRLSLLQLLESVETLETRVDTALPQLQREISKTEFSLARIVSTTALLQEEQTNQKKMVKALSASVEALQNRHTGTSSSIRDLNNITDGSKNTTNGLADFMSSLKRIETEYRDIVHKLPFDCGSTRGGSAGVYPISPGEGPPLLTSCHDGWTVFQRRVDGTQDFNRKWADYANGFGTPADEFWLGNKALHRLTADNCSSLRIDMTDIYGGAWIVEYRYFHVASEEDGFRIHVSGYHGNASDALTYQNGMEFSTLDSDRDISHTHCAENYEGGWWFSHCQHANLNGKYNLGLTWFDSTRNEWIAVAASEMKVRRAATCPYNNSSSDSST